MSKERPILFNDEMVRAILEGRKSQTRRLVPEWQLPGLTLDGDQYISIAQRHPRWGFGVFGKTEAECMANYSDDYRSCCPFGKPGDRLWVREAFAPGLCTESTLAYRATHKPSDLEEGWYEPIKWTPSIHMPHWASRITLEITDVRVERLQDISEADSENEGCAPAFLDEFGNVGGAPFYRRGFCKLWREIYGHDSWGENPWVWVISFKRVEQEVKAA